MTDILNIICEIACWKMAQDLPDDKYVSLGNGLVPWGNKPLPEPNLTKINESICYHIWPQWEFMEIIVNP